MSARRVARDCDIVFIYTVFVCVIAKEIVCVDAIFEVLRKKHFGAKSMVYNRHDSTHNGKTSCVSVATTAVVYHPTSPGDINNKRCFF